MNHSSDNVGTAAHVKSYYTASAGEIPQMQMLRGIVDADVCIVGAGYTGLSTALHLVNLGQRVVILEANKIGWGASGRNGGHVGTGQRRDQSELEKMLGQASARRLWDLSLDAVQLVKDLIVKYDIDCDLKSGILHVAAKRHDVAGFRQEAAQLQQDYGYEDVRYVEREETCAMLGTDRYFAGLLDSRSAHLHPLKYALGLARAAIAAGVVIFENSRVTGITDAEAVVLKTSAGTVRARRAVLACNGYLDSLAPKIAGRIMPINNFILATEPLGKAGARALIRDDVAVSDSLFVINYWKLSADNRLLFGGGENYSRKFPGDIKSFVRKYLLRIYPQLHDTAIEYAWGGTLAITRNRMPDIGMLSPNILYSQGYSGHGVPTATMAGKLLANQLMGDSEDFALLSSVPKHSFPGGTLLRWPGLVAGMLYYSLRDRLRI